jgi:hypothetical protein
MRRGYIPVAVLALAMGAFPCSAQPVAEQLQRGIYEQQTAGDLDNAIRTYRQILASRPIQRVYAAQAQTYLAQALLQEGAVPGAPTAEPKPAAASNAEAQSEDAGDLADAHTGAFKVQVRSLYDKGAFSELDAIADQARSQKLRFKGGAWRLYVFYKTIGSPGSLTATDAEWHSRIAKLQQWMAASPTSPAPRVGLAHAYIRFAWKARGNGSSGTVTPQGWALFGQRIQSARTVLEEAAKTTPRDAQWYREMQTVALAQGWDRAQVDALASEALANEPSYYYFAVAQANFLLPKWYGKPGESEKYAEQVADQAGGPEGEATYFEIASELNCCRRTQAPALSWPRVRQGFAALDQLYGSTNHQRNVMAYLSLRAGDTETAQKLFARIRNDWDEDVWRSKALFDASRTGQPVSNTQPLRADGAAAGTATERD